MERKGNRPGVWQSGAGRARRAHTEATAAGGFQHPRGGPLTMAGTCFGNYYCFAHRKQRWNTCSCCGTNLTQVAKVSNSTYACALCFDAYIATVEPARAGNHGCMPLQMTTSFQGGGRLDRVWTRDC